MTAVALAVVHIAQKGPALQGPPAGAELAAAALLGQAMLWKPWNRARAPAECWRARATWCVPATSRTALVHGNLARLALPEYGSRKDNPDAADLSVLKWEASLQRQDMIEAVRAAASAAAIEGHMKWGAARSMLSTYERLLDSYTYLSF